MAVVDISSYKMELIEKMINCDDLVKGIDSQSPNFSPKDYSSLIYNNIFPYLHIKFTQDEGDAYILIAVDVLNINRKNPTFLDMRVIIWAMSHVSRQRMPSGLSTRTDYMAEEIRKLFDGSKTFGLGGILELTSSREVIYNESYQYRELIFRTSDMKLSSYNKVGSFI